MYNLHNEMTVYFDMTEIPFGEALVCLLRALILSQMTHGSEQYYFLEEYSAHLRHLHVTRVWRNPETIELCVEMDLAKMS